MSESDPPAIECTLTNEQRQERAERIQSVLADRYKGVIECDDGYSLRFDGSDEALSAIATFVTNERRCCSFAEYSIDISPPYEETRLTITGPDGSKSLFDGLFDHLSTPEATE
ncbi:Zn-dependent oxidoreductase [Natrialbaceae archaeon A-arb3/5]